MTYDAASDRVYVMLGCNGMAVYDVSDPLAAPVLLGHRYPAIPGPSTSWQILPGPGIKLYIATLNHGIGVMEDFNQFQTSPITFYPTRSQAVGMVQDPSNAQRLFLAEGSVGTGHVDLSAPPI